MGPETLGSQKASLISLFKIKHFFLFSYSYMHVEPNLVSDHC